MTNLAAIYRDDELYLILRRQTYHLFGTVNGKRVRKSCRTQDLARAKIILENTKRELNGGWRDGESDKDWMKVADFMYDRQRYAAARRKISFDLTRKEIYFLMRSTGFRCAVSGIPFSKNIGATGKRDPWAPSIDRIEGRHGYTMENCRVVSLAANIALADWGLDVLLRLSRGVLRSSIALPEELSQNSPKNGSEIQQDIDNATKIEMTHFTGDEL